MGWRIRKAIAGQQYTTFRCIEDRVWDQVLFLFGGGDLAFRVFLAGGQAAFGEQEASQGAEIVQNATAGGDMKVQFGQVVGDQKESFFAAVGTILLGGGNFLFDVAARFVHGFGEHPNVFVRALDTVKRRFGLIAH